jgi:NADPH2:quinone reductase
MRAIVITESATAASLHIQDIPTPAIDSPHQVLVRLKAAGINPLDIKIRENKNAFPVQPQAILGCDGAGVIEAIGTNVSDFTIGDEVFFCQPGLNGRQGTYADYVVVDEAVLAPKPESLSFVQAAAIPLVLITAWEALHDRVNIKPDAKVLIEAGAGGVGHVAIQLAILAGASVATTVSTNQKAAFVEQLGAQKVIRYHHQDVVEEILNWTDQQGVDIAFDTLGGEVMQRCFSSVRCYGDVVTILTPDANTDWSDARLKNIRFTQELMLTPFFLNSRKDIKHQSDILKRNTPDLNQSRLTVNVAKSFPLEQVSSAHQYWQDHAPIGKLVLEI